MNLLRKILHSRLFMVWGITLVVIIIGLAITLVLIAHSKRTRILDAPPKLPDTPNTTDILPPPEQVNIFLLNPTSLEITPVQVELRLYSEPTERLKQIVSALVQETLPNYRNPIPRGTLLNEAYIDSQKTAYLDFSHHLADGHIGGTTAELLTVTAILKTVFDAFPNEIIHVQILIDGKEKKTLAGHLNLSQPMRF
ncbi:MAG: GerMN domain-containing protein [Candidatus Poribacteria bacterium]|nr:GerMN domain-containing protein [Candidatus Poribacteria bacterium]